MFRPQSGVNWCCLTSGDAFSKYLKARVITHGRSEAVLIPREFWFSVDYVYIQRDPRTCDLILSDRPPQPDDSSKPDWKEISRKLDEAGAADF